MHSRVRYENFNALMTALSLLRSGSEVTLFLGSRGINAVHKQKIKELKCMPDAPNEVSDAVMKKMEDLLTMLLACPLNKDLFGFKDEDLIEGVKIADPSTYYTDIVMKADMNLTF